MRQKESEAFLIARHRLRAKGRTKMARGYRKDPREYETGTLIKEPTCEDCNSWRKTGEITIGGITRQEPKRRICKQDGICNDWTPFPQETEGSINADNDKER